MSDIARCSGRMRPSGMLPMCSIVCRRYADGPVPGDRVVWIEPAAQPPKDAEGWTCANLMTKHEPNKANPG